MRVSTALSILRQAQGNAFGLEPTNYCRHLVPPTLGRCDQAEPGDTLLGRCDQAEPGDTLLGRCDQAEPGDTEPG
jgi:hypothetical protein